MNFNNLSNEQKKELHEKIMECANNIGGVNPFLQMLEDIRASKTKALLNKTAIFHFNSGKLDWGKSIFKDTLSILYNAMAKEEKDGDIISGLPPKEYKTTMNMMRTLKPILVKVSSKNEKYDGFDFNILDSSEDKKTKVDLIFKIIFFFNLNFAKQVLNYKII